MARLPITQGASTDTATDVLRKFLLPLYRGKPGWEAMIAAIGSGDQGIADNAQKAFDQLFLSTASGFYLQRKGSDVGIVEPTNVGMSDADYRRLAIKLTAKKVVTDSISEILEVFYGEDATRANVVNSISSTYALTSGDQLILSIDNTVVTVTFNASDFADISKATQSEVAGVITRTIEYAGLNGFAGTKTDNTGNSYIVIYSGVLGLDGSVSVIGGIANNALKFPTNLSIWPFFSSVIWTISQVRPGVYRIAYKSGSVPRFLNVMVGDYVNLDFSNLTSVRGSYLISNVFQDYNGSTNTAYIDFYTPDASWPASSPITVPTDVLTSTITTVQVYHPTIYYIQDVDTPAFLAQSTTQHKINVVMPATSSVVQRNITDAAYFYDNTTYSPLNAYLFIDGSIRVNFSGTPPTALTTIGSKVRFSGFITDTSTRGIFYNGPSNFPGYSKINDTWTVTSVGANYLMFQSNLGRAVWDPNFTYYVNQVVMDPVNGRLYIRCIDAGDYSTPPRKLVSASSQVWRPITWDPNFNYFTDWSTMGSDGALYRSKTYPNIGHDPVSSPTYWDSYLTYYTSNYNSYLIAKFNTGTLSLVSAPSSSSTYNGPNLIDPQSGLTLSSPRTTTTQNIPPLQNIGFLSVTSTSGFPSSGWLVIGFGTSQQVGPIKYIGLYNSTTFWLDNQFVFNSGVLSGATVDYVSDNAAYIPTSTSIGLVWITDSTSATVAAKQYITDMAAAGVTTEFSVTTPNNWGLGTSIFGI